ncbi:MAG: tetratricopeptide repeat protein [Kiloniellaceae bacterium]
MKARVEKETSLPPGRRAATPLIRALCAAITVAAAGCAPGAEEPGVPRGEARVAAPAPGTLALAERALAEGRYGEAGILLDRVLLDAPDDPRAKLIAAELFLAQGAPKPAAEAFGSVTPSPEVGAAALQGEGIALLLLGERDAGYASLRRAVEADPTLWRAWNALGYYYDLRGAWEQAAVSYLKALAANPRSAVVHNNRGFSLLMQQRFEEAQEDLERAVRIDPGFVLARENLRLALAWQGKYLHALSGVPEKGRAKALNNIGFIALLRGDYANAEAFFLRAMELDPSYNEIASRNLAYLNDVRSLDTNASRRGIR